MTGGKVVVLGKTGRNFAAGMSGGIAYILDFDEIYCNKSLVILERIGSEEEMKDVKGMIEKHTLYTGSPLGSRVLDDWKTYSQRITKVIPKDYKQMLENIDNAHKSGLSGEEALMAAFERELKK